MKFECSVRFSCLVTQTLNSNRHMFKLRSYSLVPLIAVVLFSGGDVFGQVSNLFCAKRGFREDLQQGVVLTATSNAPARAAGRAQIVAINDNGTNTSVLFVKTTGLTNGTYYVSVGQQGSSNLTSLGSLNVAHTRRCFMFGCGFGYRRGDGHTCGSGIRYNRGDDEDDDDDDDDDQGDWRQSDRHHGDNDDDDGDRWDWNRWNGTNSVGGNFTNWINGCSRMDSAFKHLVCGSGATNGFRTNIYQWYTNCLTVGSGSFLLPSGMVQSNVTDILISDSGGNVVLAGDFTGVTKSTSIYIETVNLVPGTATNLQGSATLKLISRNTRTVGSFKLFATGLEHLQRLYLTANGTNTFRVRTSAVGTLRIRTLPRTKLVDLQTLIATDASSNVVFSASF